MWFVAGMGYYVLATWRAHSGAGHTKPVSLPDSKNILFLRLLILIHLGFKQRFKVDLLFFCAHHHPPSFVRIGLPHAPQPTPCCQSSFRHF